VGFCAINNSKIDIYIFFAEFGDEVLCVSPAGVSTSHVCHTALTAGYSAVHSAAVTVHSRYNSAL